MEDVFGRNYRYGVIPDVERARMARRHASHGRGALPQRLVYRPSLFAIATEGKARACDLHNVLGSRTAPRPHFYRMHPW